MVAIRQVVTGSAVAANVSLTAGAGTVIGDVLIALVGSAYGGTLTTSPTGTGWTLLATEGAWWFPPKAAVWRRVATAAGSQSYTFTYTGSYDHHVALYVLSSAGATADAEARWGVWTRHQQAPSVTASTAADLLLCGAVSAGIGDYTPPDGMTERSDVDLTGYSTMSTASLALTSAGRTGRRAFYGTSASMHATMAVAVRDNTSVTIAIGQAVETETAQPLTVLGNVDIITLGQAVESETAGRVRDSREVAYTALITALAEPDKQYTASLEVDWDGDFSYGHVLSDLSSLATSVTVDRDLTGTMPDDITLIEGYISGQLTADLAGRHTDYPDLNAAQLFAPHNTDSPLHGVTRQGRQVRYSIITTTDAGPVPLRQFTGRLRAVAVNAKDRSAQLTCTDWVEDMRTLVDLPVVGSAAGHVFNPTWVLDWLLRQAQLYASPPARSDAVMVATLAGAWWPEVGLFDDEVNGIHISLGPPWVPARYSYAANADATHRAYQDYHATAGYAPRASTAVGIGFWVYWSPSIGATQVAYFFADTPDTTRYCNLATDGAGAVVAALLGPAAYSKLWTGPTITTTGWHYIGLHLSFSSGGVPTARFSLDGTVTSAGTGAAYSMVLTVPTRSQVRIDIMAQVSSVQVWRPGTADFTFPMTVDAVSTNLELAVQQLRTLPDRSGVQALEVFKEIAQADLGAVGADENGVVYFLRRSTIQEAAIGIEWNLTPAECKDMSISDSLDQVRNVINGKVAPTTVFRGDPTPMNNVVYDAPSVGLLQTPAGTTRVARVPFGDDGAAWVREGAVPFTNPWVDDAVQHGFHVRDVANTIIPAGVTVSVRRVDPRILEVTVVNTSGSVVELKDSSGNPALRVQGSRIHVYDRPQVDTDPAFDFTVTDTASVEKYGRRLYTIPDNDWRQDWTDSYNLALSLESDTVEPIPTIEMLPTIGHPGRRLGDTATAVDPDGLGGPFTGVIVGLNRTLSTDGGLTDSLTPKLIEPPG